MRRWVVVVVVAGVIVISGCSAADDEGGSQREASSTTSVVSELPVSEGAAGPGSEHRAFCERYGVLDRLFDELPDGSLEELRASLRTLAVESAVVAEDAPDEVADDAQAMAAYFSEWEGAAAAATTQEQAADASTEVASAAEFQEAGQRLHAWVEENCPT